MEELLNNPLVFRLCIEKICSRYYCHAELRGHGSIHGVGSTIQEAIDDCIKEMNNE